MKFCYRLPIFLLALWLLGGWAEPAHALTNQDIAGIYQGTSMGTLPDGQTINVNLKLSIKANGKLKRVATVNGQTIKARSELQFVSEHGVLESPDDGTGESLGFVDLDGVTLTLNLVVRLKDGQVLKEVTTVTRVR